MTTLQDQLTAMRTADGEIERRLSELDAKLGAWIAVVQAGHTALLELAKTIVPGAVPREAQRALDQPAAEPPARPLTDEELLKTLDDETAQAIRVRRRLCHGSRSVQQLLEDHRAAQAQQHAEQQSKSAARRGWWRRKND